MWEPPSAPPPLSPCFLFPYLWSLVPLWGLVLPRGPYSVLSSSAISSMGCQRLRTWYQGLPLVHPLPCGVSGFTQPDAHPGLHGKHPAILRRLPAQSTGTLARRGLCLFPLSLTPTAPQFFTIKIMTGQIWWQTSLVPTLQRQRLGVPERL